MDNRVARYWRVLHKQLIRGKCWPNEQTSLGVLMDETKRIAERLLTDYRWESLKKEDIIAIFERIIYKLKKNPNSNINYYKRSIYILLNYIKTGFFLWNEEMTDDIFNKYFHDPILKPFFLEYLEDINANVYNSNVEPYIELTYSLYIQWIKGDYNIIDDLNWDDFIGIKNLLERKMQNIWKNPQISVIEELCALFWTINQLALIQTINAEEKRNWIKLYREILLTWIKKAIKLYLEGIGISWVDEVLNNLEGGTPLEIFWNKLSPDQLKSLSLLQDLYWRFLINFEWNIDYSSINYWENLKEVLYRISQLAQNGDENTKNGLRLRKIANYWNKTWEELENMNSRFELISRINRIYIKINETKSYVRAIKANNENLTHEGKVIMSKVEKTRKEITSEIISLYKETFEESDFIKNENDVIRHFISLENPDSAQIIIILDLILNESLSVDNLYSLTNYLVNLKWDRSAIFEKNKIRALEAIIEELSKIPQVCEIKDVECPWYAECKNSKKDSVLCQQIITSIAKFASSSNADYWNSKRYLVYNYWKLFLSLAYLYSKWKSPEHIEYAKKYFIIFQEKYSYILTDQSEKWDTELQVRYKDPWVQDIVDEIKENIGRAEIETYSVEKSLKTYSISEALTRRSSIEEEIFKIIRDIQWSKWKYDEDKEKEIKKGICRIISLGLFDWMCEIQVLPQWKTHDIWRFEGLEVIECNLFKTDIIFKYSTDYKRNFQHLFNKEKESIRNHLLILIWLSTDYTIMWKDFSAMITFICRLMESKDLYTKWHVKRVTELTLTIWEILWLNYTDLRTAYICSLVHDYGKIGIPDIILKSSWYLSDEEREVMATHTWLWIEEWVKNWIDSYTYWMPHHCMFYDEIKNNTSLIYEELLKKLKKWEKVELSNFNKLAWNNIPPIARIIMIWDVIDAIASRRIYDKNRAHWSIQELLDEIRKELITCAWLMISWDIIEIDTNKWQKVNEKTVSPYKITIDWKHYIPKSNSNVKIMFDPTIVLALFGDRKTYKKIEEKIKESDRENVEQKIPEIENNITILEVKKRRYYEGCQNIIEKNRRIVEVLIGQEIISLEEEERALRAIHTVNALDDSQLSEQEKIFGINIIFTKEDEVELDRLKKLLVAMKQIKEDYNKMPKKQST